MRRIILAEVTTQRLQLATVLHHHRVQNLQLAVVALARCLTDDHGIHVRIIVEGNAQRFAWDDVRIEDAVLALLCLEEVDALRLHPYGTPAAHGAIHELLGEALRCSFQLMLVAVSVAVNLFHVQRVVIAVTCHGVLYVSDGHVEHTRRHLLLHALNEVLAQDVHVLQGGEAEVCRALAAQLLKRTDELRALGNLRAYLKLGQHVGYLRVHRLRVLFFSLIEPRLSGCERSITHEERALAERIRFVVKPRMVCLDGCTTQGGDDFTVEFRFGDELAFIGCHCEYGHTVGGTRHGCRNKVPNETIVEVQHIVPSLRTLVGFSEA